MSAITHLADDGVVLLARLCQPDVLTLQPGEVQKRAEIAFEVWPLAACQLALSLSIQETKQYMESEEGLQKIEQAKKKAEDLALKALGEDVVQQVAPGCPAIPREAVGSSAL